MGSYVKTAALAAAFLLAAANLFPQDETPQRGSIPEELLRPRRGESPRYPIDTVIGELGQGRAPKEAYECAKKAAEAFLAGTMTAPVFSSVNKVFLESCMSALNAVNPRYYRLGGGREEPDGSVSFLVRFAGREQGITGELFIRREQKRIEPPAAQKKAAQDEPERNEEEGEPEDGGAEIAEVLPEAPVQIETIWIFDDIILEEARGREAENGEVRHRFNFPPYERIF